MADDEKSNEARSTIASRNATVLFHRSMTAWNSVLTFRWMAQVGLPSAVSGASKAHLQTMKEIATEERYAEMFKVDRAVMIKQGFFGKAAALMTEEAAKSYETSIDAASLIFAHSILDNSILEWLKICWLVAPDDFFHLIERRQFPWPR